MSKAKEEFEQFERRAAIAEEQIKLLCERVEKLEKDAIPSASGSGKDLVDYQKQTLSELQHLRQTMEGERKEMLQAIKQRDEATKAKDDLEKQNEKLEYRIKFLLRSLNEEELKNKELRSKLGLPSPFADETAVSS